jgi:hypothetical protein
LSVSSSTSTSWPTLKPALLATCTEVAPLSAFAVRFTEAASAGHLSPIRMRGFATVLVFRSLVADGPAPRRTMPLLTKIGWGPLTRKSPAESCTTCPTGQALMAAWMADVASVVPFP